MDKKIKKPYIPFQKKKLFSSMMVKFSLILFLILICYISYFGYVKTYKPLRLSKFQYNTYKNGANLLAGDTNLPEGIPETGDFTYAKNLGQCPHGSCVIDKESGIKRCPEYVEDRLTYNIILEACTRLETCDYEELPFAIRSDGNSQENICEQDSDGNWVPCRCTNIKRCKPNIVSKFTIVTGDRFGAQQNNTARNFQIASILGDEDQNQLGYFNIEIDEDDDFCTINPTFTNTIVDGCDFKNAIQDKLGCEYISNVNFDSVNSVASSWVIGSQRYGDFYSEGWTPDFNGDPINYSGGDFCTQTNVGQDFLVLIRPVSSNEEDKNYYLPEENGYLKIEGPISKTNLDKKTQIIRYDKKVNGGVNTIGGEAYIGIILLGITNVKTFPDLVTGVGQSGLAFPFLTDLSGCGTLEQSGNTVLTPQNITNTYCRFTNDIANYKNLLMCTQNNNNLCTYGELTYQIDNFTQLSDTGVTITDDSYTRSFCQLNPLNDPLLLNQEYLNDPIKYTLSCSIGQGCDGYNFPLDSKDKSRDAMTRYFPDVDIDAIRGKWEMGTCIFPVINAESSEQLLNNNNINPGDYWSIKTVNETILPLEDLKAGQSTIVVDNLFGLGVFVNIPLDEGACIYPTLAPRLSFTSDGTSYRLLRADYKTDGFENISSIGISPPLIEDFPAFTPINIYTENFNLLDTFGIITKKEPTEKSSGKNSDLVLSRLDGTPVEAIFPAGVKVNLDLYKQFSFSGANYNTRVIKNDPGISFYGNFNRRLYLNGKGIPYVFEVADASRDNYGTSTYPYPPQDIFQMDINLLNIVNPTYNSTFSSPMTPYKIPMSMYYPVWNQATYQQECMRCKPYLLAFPEINTDREIKNVIVQFSGQDFGNYEYDFDTGNYYYVTSSFVKFGDNSGINTSTRLFLQEPNPNIKEGDFVLDSTLQLDHEVLLSGSFDPKEKYDYLQIVPEIFPSDNAVHGIESNIFEENLININAGDPPNDTYPFSFGVEESTSTNYKIKGVEYYPNMSGSVVKENNVYIYKKDEEKLPNNYFFGKKYQPAKIYNFTMKNKKGGGKDHIPTSGFYFRPVRRVSAVSPDNMSIVLDSPFPYVINKPGENQQLILQFCRLDKPLKIKTVKTTGEVYENTELKISSISDSRITSIVVNKSDKFLRNNLPVIQIDMENQNFI